MILGMSNFDSAPYNSYVQFYHDMLIFWKNFRKCKNLKTLLKNSGFNGIQSFKQHWNRLFIDMELTNKSNDNGEILFPQSMQSLKINIMKRQKKETL